MAILYLKIVLRYVYLMKQYMMKTLQWRHNGRGDASNHQPHCCLLNRLFKRRWKKTSKLRVAGLCVRNSPVTGEFPAQMASNAEMFPFDDVIMNCCEMLTQPRCRRRAVLTNLPDYFHYYHYLCYKRYYNVHTIIFYNKYILTTFQIYNNE